MINVKGTIGNFAKGAELFPEEGMLKSPPKPKPNAFVWRYMSLEKYISVLMNRGFSFAYPGTLDDPFEATVPPRTWKRLYDWLIEQQNVPVRQFKQIVDVFIHNIKNQHVVSCWHAMPPESDAM